MPLMKPSVMELETRYCTAALAERFNASNEAFTDGTDQRVTASRFRLVSFNASNEAFTDGTR